MVLQEFDVIFTRSVQAIEHNESAHFLNVDPAENLFWFKAACSTMQIQTKKLPCTGSYLTTLALPWPNIGGRIREWRLEQGLSQRDLAKINGIRWNGGSQLGEGESEADEKEFRKNKYDLEI